MSSGWNNDRRNHHQTNSSDYRGLIVNAGLNSVFKLLKYLRWTLQIWAKFLCLYFFFTEML